MKRLLIVTLIVCLGGLLLSGCKCTCQHPEPNATNGPAATE